MSFFRENRVVFFQITPETSRVFEDTLPEPIVQLTQVLRNTYQLNDFLGKLEKEETAKFSEAQRHFTLESSVRDYKVQVDALRKMEGVSSADGQKLESITENLVQAFELYNEPKIFGWIEGCLKDALTVLEMSLRQQEKEKAEIIIASLRMSKEEITYARTTVREATFAEQQSFEMAPDHIQSAAKIMAHVLEGVPHCVFGSLGVLVQSGRAPAKIDDIDANIPLDYVDQVDVNLQKLASGKEPLIFKDSQGTQAGWNSGIKKACGTCPDRTFFMKVVDASGCVQYVEADITAEGKNEKGEHQGTLQLGNFHRRLTNISVGEKEKLHFGEVEPLADVYVMSMLMELGNETIDAFSSDPGVKAKFWMRVHKFAAYFDVQTLQGVIEIVETRKTKYLETYGTQCPEVRNLYENADKVIAFLQEKNQEYMRYLQTVGGKVLEHSTTPTLNTEFLGNFAELCEALKICKKVIGHDYVQVLESVEAESMEKVLVEMNEELSDIFEVIQEIRKSPEKYPLQYCSMIAFLDDFVQKIYQELTARFHDMQEVYNIDQVLKRSILEKIITLSTYRMELTPSEKNC